MIRDQLDYIWILPLLVDQKLEILEFLDYAERVGSYMGRRFIWRVTENWRRKREVHSLFCEISMKFFTFVIKLLCLMRLSSMVNVEL